MVKSIFLKKNPLAPFYEYFLKSVHKIIDTLNGQCYTLFRELYKYLNKTFKGRRR